MYNPQLETFLRVADAGSFNKVRRRKLHHAHGCHQANQSFRGIPRREAFRPQSRGLTLTKAGRSMYQDAKYIIRYCRDSVTRAKNAMQEDENIIRIGSSPIDSGTTPDGTLVQSSNSAPGHQISDCPL